MIKNFKELRVGNFVFPSVFYTGIYANVPHVVTAPLLKDMSRDVATLLQYDPIPLTDEELRRLGFSFEPCGVMVLDTQGEMWTKVKFSDDFWLWRHREGVLKHPSCKKPITGLHQLQNLYFVLMGEEMPLP